MQKRGKFHPAIIPLLIGFLLILVALILVKPGLTGNAISIPPNNCNIENIKLVWESIFNETSNGITINCTIINNHISFTAYKIKAGQEAYSLTGGELDWGGILGLGNVTSLQAAYINFSKDYLNITNINLTEITDLSKIHLTNITKRSIQNTDYSQSEFIKFFRVIPENWQSSSMNNEPDYSFTNTTTSGNIIISNVGSVYKNYSINILLYSKSTISQSSSNCTPNWTATTINCSTQESGVTYYSDTNNCQNSSTRPANITTYCDYDHNGIIGSFTSFTDHNLDLTLLINGILPNSSQVYNSTKTIEFKEGNLTRIKFDYDFSNPLNLKNITIEKQSSDFDYGYIIVKGLGVNKILTMDRLSSLTNEICAVNKEILDIADISDNCNESGEYLLNCPGNNSFISCNITEGKYIISGLTHSAVKETFSLGSSSCTPNWTCSSWSLCSAGQQTRTCTDLNNCNNFPPLNNNPAESQTCLCIPQWDCSAFLPVECPKNQTQTRTCTDLNNCNSNQGKLPEKQTCTYTAKINFKIIIVIILVILALLATIVIAYFIMKNVNKAKSSKEDVIIAKPQIPPAQMPMNPYPMQKPLPPILPPSLPQPIINPNPQLPKQIPPQLQQNQTPPQNSQQQTLPDLPPQKDNTNQQNKDNP